MWYYELNGQCYGPVGKEVLSNLFHTRKINLGTMVWREDWTDWSPLHETSIASSPAVPPPLEQNSSINVPSVLPPSTRLKSRQPQSINSKGLKSLFWWWFGTMIFIVPYLIVFSFLKISEMNIIATCMAAILALPVGASSILQFILIYKFWKVVQDGYARTTSGRAVGFLFIPLFNIYWFFHAYYGLAKDLNGYMNRNFRFMSDLKLHRAHPIIALSFVIFYWIMIISNIVIEGIILSKGNYSFTSSSGLINPLLRSGLIYLIVYVVWVILEVIMFFDLFFSAKSILDAESQQV